MFDDSNRLRLLHELGLAFASRTDLDDLCRLVTDKCAEVLRAEGASILLLDPESDELFFPYVSNTDPDVAARLRDMRFPASQGIAGHTLRHGRAIRVDDAATDPRSYRNVDAGSGVTTRNLLAAPLRAEHGPIGVLQVVNRCNGSRFDDADLEFLEAIAGSVAVAVENARLLAQTRVQLVALQLAAEEHAALEALRRELDIARDIQQSLQPTTVPTFPQRPELALCATMLPAHEVGGDFFDFFRIDDRRLGVVIGDVSGKGMPAALFMAVSRTLVRATALSGLAPRACLERVNRLLLDENTAEMFVTLFYGVVDVASGSLTYANGGHNPPWLRRADGRCELLRRSGPLLGVLPESSFTERSTTLADGDTLLLYTDGITEAADPSSELYGDERLESFVRSASTAEPTPFVRALIDDVQEHSGSAPQTDDITVLALRLARQPS